MIGKSMIPSRFLPGRNLRSGVITSILLLAIAIEHPAVPAQGLSDPGGDAILNHLNAVIDWYRHSLTRLPAIGLPSDALYQFNLQSMAAEAAQLAFQSAQAQAAMLPAQASPLPGETSQTNLPKLQSEMDARIIVLKAQIASLDAQIPIARKSDVANLTAQKDRDQGELDLRNTMHDALLQMNTFVNTNSENKGGGLQGSINGLRRSVPELSGANSSKPVAKPAPAAAPASTGLIGEVITLYEQLEGMHQISQMMQETAQVRGDASALLAPLQAILRTTIQQGDQLSGSNNDQPPSGLTTPLDRKQFDALAVRFRQIANAALPLSQEIILLDQSSSNLAGWRQSLVHESNRLLRSILVRVISISLAIGIILLLSEIWRRITFRYIADVRRRRQFLFLRRVVTGFCMGIVLILGFVSEFSSLATFAGFITAGLAVGLQTILLSVAAYFFLVGRWGIRVGDRISVAGVTGEVVDVGLVRLYLMELAGFGVDLYPTGRIVVFSNSVLFQATTPLFKQLPGSEYTWHEVAVTLNPGGQFALVESLLLDAVHAVHSPYGVELQHQLGTTERHIDIQMKAPEPHGQLQFTDTGLEYAVRYPVGLRQIAEADEKLTRTLMDLLQKQPELQSSMVGFPKIRAAVKG